MRLERLSWQEVAPHVPISCRGDEADIAAEVDAQIAEAWRINDGQAHMITRLEQNAEGVELVVIALEGRGLAGLAPSIINAGRAAGARSIRFHYVRPGMLRMLKPFGFDEVERVARASL
jgi:hypothetical protein